MHCQYGTVADVIAVKGSMCLNSPSLDMLREPDCFVGCQRPKKVPEEIERKFPTSFPTESLLLVQDFHNVAYDSMGIGAHSVESKA